MRHIAKPNQVPEKLIAIQHSIADRLFEKKDKFDWRTEHYSDPIKENLKTLYHNKCAFCQVELTETDMDNKFTVEHYRPKSIYYWLGAEWTNLFPTCKGCNTNKGNDFPLLSERNRYKNPPFDETGKLILEKCNANHTELRSEKPLFLHPELDVAERYFIFEATGKIDIAKNLSSYEAEQARKMLHKFLQRPSIEEKRKLKIIYYQDRLRNLLTKGIPKLGENYSKRDIELLFFDFFTDMEAQQQADAEFSMLGAYMIKNFDNFFLNKLDLDIDVYKLVQYAYKLHFQMN